MNNEGIDSILAKDYPLEYKPIKLFNVTGNTRRLTLDPKVKSLKLFGEADSAKKKWKESCFEGSMKALYRANLEDLSGDELMDEVPSEKEILWDAIEGEVAIVPDTSSLMDGLMSRLLGPEEERTTDLHLYLSPMVIKELQRHAMSRTNRFELKGGKRSREEQLILFADLKRKARIALRALSELVELKNKKYIRLKVIERKNSEDGVPDWEIISDAKLLHVDMPKYFVSNDLIQSTLAEVVGLKTRYMYPLHLLELKEISLKGKQNVGRAFYELAVQFGELIIESDNFTVTLQSDWPNKMSPSWVKKTILLKIEYDDMNIPRKELLKILNRGRYEFEKIKQLDPRFKTLF